jgi:ABC-2 type transport system permease protein
VLHDLRTVAWKEWKSLLRYRGRRRQLAVALVSPLLLAFYIPLDASEAWVNGGLSFFPAIVVPIILTGILVPDSFAGERERHTLPTLLSTRLPDTAILFGKILVSQLFSWTVAVCVLLLGLVTYNLSSWNGHFQFYTPGVFIAATLISFLCAAATAGAGVLISLRSSTVQEAQQLLFAVIFVPPMILQALVFVLGRTAVSGSLRSTLQSIPFEGFVVGLILTLFVIALAFFYASMRRFDRARLILDD